MSVTHAANTSYNVYTQEPSIERRFEPPTLWEASLGDPSSNIFVRREGELWVFVAPMGQGSSIQFENPEQVERAPYSSGAASDAPPVQPPARTVAEQITFLRQDLGLTVSEIADWMGVTRPAVYGWLKDVQPQPETLRMIAKVDATTTALADLKLHRPDHIIKRPLFNGRSALDVLRDGDLLTPEQLSTLKDLDQREQARRRTHVSGTPVRSLSDTAGDSTPIMQS